MKGIKFTYNPDSFENPALQKHYVNIEAMALDRDAPEEITDYTCEIHKYLFSLEVLRHFSTVPCPYFSQVQSAAPDCLIGNS